MFSSWLTLIFVLSSTSLNLYCSSLCKRCLDDPIALVRSSISCMLFILFSFLALILNSTSSRLLFSSICLRSAAAASAYFLFSTSALIFSSAFFLASSNFFSLAFFSSFILLTSSLHSSCFSLSNGYTLFTGCINDNGTLIPPESGEESAASLSYWREDGFSLSSLSRAISVIFSGFYVKAC